MGKCATKKAILLIKHKPEALANMLHSRSDMFCKAGKYYSQNLAQSVFL